jgi:hypothetical protein
MVALPELKLNYGYMSAERNNSVSKLSLYASQGDSNQGVRLYIIVPKAWPRLCGR